MAFGAQRAALQHGLVVEQAPLVEVQPTREGAGRERGWEGRVNRETPRLSSATDRPPPRVTPSRRARLAKLHTRTARRNIHAPRFDVVQCGAHHIQPLEKVVVKHSLTNEW